MTFNEGPFAHAGKLITDRDVEEQKEYDPESLLPPVFQFSQASLQDYVDCARRFQLRYVEGQRWPAAEASPIEEREQFMAMGQEFHLLVQRHLSGVPADQLTPADPLLAGWWRAYLDNPPPDLPSGELLPETVLSTPVDGHRLLARFDLLAIDSGERIVIVDWKTSKHPPAKQTMGQRLQTKVYPFVLAEAGSQLFGGKIRPEQISLMYWFAQAPKTPHVFAYDAKQHEDNRRFFTDLITEITTGNRDSVWPLTDDIEKKCNYCVYRSLCDRGVRAGDFDASEEDTGEADFDFDLDSIDEIAF